MVSGAFMSAKDDPTCVHFTNEELEMAVKEAKRLNKKVMDHAHSTKGTLN
jgi:imidazolonepropionase-like amidohydrolase